jgi:hypothetical protein
MSDEIRKTLFLAMFSVLALVALVGCGDDRSPPKAGARMVGFHPDHLPDIPLPRAGYQFDPAYDQLAMVTAGGLVRRFEVSMIQRANAAEQTQAELLAWYKGDLTATGWTLAEGGDEKQLWRKGSEELRLETGRSGGRTTIRLRLRPTQ